MPFPAATNYFKLRSELPPAETAFPNATSAVAELRPHSQSIHLHKIDRRTWATNVAARKTENLADPFSVIAHELGHWLDLVGTVWGQQYLVELFDAYEAALNTKQDPEGSWWKVVRQFDQDRRIMFPRYYQVAHGERSPHSPTRPWTIDYTCGQEFKSDGKIDQEHPIFFVVFGENETRERVARQPLSIGTLLETNATWAELVTGISILSHIDDADERKINVAFMAKKANDTLYDMRLTEYTAPVHLLSARVHTHEAMLSYHAGAALATVCLNLTEESFENLHVPETFAVFGKDRVDAFRVTQNRGFAFACLAFNAPEFSQYGDVDAWLAATLDRSGLPDHQGVSQLAYAKVESLHRAIGIRWWLDHVRDYLLEFGRSVMVARSSTTVLEPLPVLIGKKLPLPPMFDSEGELFEISKHALDRSRFDAEGMFYSEVRLRKFTYNFLEGCRGFIS